MISFLTSLQSLYYSGSHKKLYKYRLPRINWKKKAMISPWIKPSLLCTASQIGRLYGLRHLAYSRHLTEVKLITESGATFRPAEIRSVAELGSGWVLRVCFLPNFKTTISKMDYFTRKRTTCKKTSQSINNTCFSGIYRAHLCKISIS